MGKINYIEDFGASEEKNINTREIQLAIDDCSASGGGRVVCGPGCYRIGTIEIKSNVELHLASGCELRGVESLSAYDDFTASGFTGYDPENSTKHLIRAINAECISITGYGRINASGLSFYSEDDISMRRKPDSPRPRTIMLYNCSRVVLKDVSLIDSPCWTVWLMKCNTVNIKGIKVFGDERLLNNDGIDIDSCKFVTLSDSIFKTQDDCIVLRSISSSYNEPAACEDITVSNCVLESKCQAIRIGAASSDHLIRRCSFSNIVIHDSGNGINIENLAKYLVESEVEKRCSIYGIVFSNFIIECLRYPIRLFVEEGLSLEKFGEITFSDFRIKSGWPCQVEGSNKTSINNVNFSNMNIETSGANGMICKNCCEIGLTNINISHRSDSE